MNKAKLIATMAKNVMWMARRLGVSFIYLVDLGSEEDFDTTGSAEWSQEAADTLTEWAMNLIDEDENAKIDELLTPLYNLENEN